MIGEIKRSGGYHEFNKVIIAKIKICCSNFRSGGFDPWRSSDFDPYRSSGIKLRSGGDRSVGRQSEEGRREERIMKGIEGS